MRRFLNRTLVIAAAMLLPAASAWCAPLKVTVKGIAAMAGTLSIQVVDSADAYDGKAKGVGGERWTPSAAEHTFSFDLPPGRYAVQVMHDKNDNGKLDSNVMGIPTEAYGFSNNPRVMRRPTFDETVFELGAAGSDIQIDLN